VTLRGPLKLIEKYGFFDFTKIVAERTLNRLTGHAVSRFFYARAMKTGAVYFGEHLGARQGVLRRHFFMHSLACREVQGGSDPFQVLEVGSYAGASAITWALALRTRPERPGEVVCVDPWRNYLTEEDIQASAVPDVLREMAEALEEGRVFQLFEHNTRAARVVDLIRPLKGRFEEVSSSLPANSCDLVYIDANHRYEAVTEDLERAARLVKPGGLLCGDDLDKPWSDVDHQYCLAHLESDVIVDPKSGQFVHAGVSKAVWDFFGGPISSWNGFWAMRKQPDGTWARVALDARFRSRELPPHLKWWKTKTQSVLALKARPAAPQSP